MKAAMVQCSVKVADVAAPVPKGSLSAVFDAPVKHTRSTSRLDQSRGRAEAQTTRNIWSTSHPPIRVWPGQLVVRGLALTQPRCADIAKRVSGDACSGLHCEHK